MENADSIIALAERARQAYASNQFTLSADLYGQAADRCAANGDMLTAAEMRNNLSVTLLRAGNPEAALTAVVGTAEIFQQAGDHRRQAIALGNHAAALEDLHRLDESLTLYRQASDLLKELNESEMRAVILKRISVIQMQKKKPVEALFSMDAAVETTGRRSWSDNLIRRLMAFIKKQMGLS